MYSSYLSSYDMDPSSHRNVMEGNTGSRDLIRWKSGKRVDPRLMTLVQLFGEMYMERREFFNKIFDGDHEEAFKKIGNLLKRKKTMKKAKSMQRSLSMRAIGQRGLDNGENSDGLRLGRFRIRTPTVIVADDPCDEEGQTTTTQGSSKYLN